MQSTNIETVDGKQSNSKRLWWKWKIHLHPNATSNWLDKNPQNINRNWPIKKNVAEVMKFLKNEWYERIKKTDIESIYTLLLWLSEETLKTLISDEWNPILVRSVALYLQNWWRDWLTVVEYVAKQALWPMQSENNTQNNFLIGSAVMKFNQLLSWNHDNETHDGE